jgi:hypothetical protein
MKNIINQVPKKNMIPFSFLKVKINPIKAKIVNNRGCSIVSYPNVQNHAFVGAFSLKNSNPNIFPELPQGSVLEE